MKFVIVSICIFFAAASWAKADKEIVTIQGKISGAEGKTIFLEYFVQNRPVKIDSFSIKKNGKFELQTKAEEIDFYRVGFGPRNFVLLALDLGEKAVLNADAENLTETYSVTGSMQSQYIRDFLEGLSDYSKETEVLNAKFNNPNTTNVEKAEIRSKADSLKKVFLTFRDAYIGKHSGDIAIMTTLTHLNDNKDYDLLKKIETDLGANYPDSKYFRTVRTKVQQIEFKRRQEEEIRKMQEQSQIGKPAPALNFPNPDGEVITIESLKGKYILIDFWASWCGPCRRENPNVVKAYAKYKKAGFTVFSVSLDKDKTRWVNAIKQDGLIWPNHVSDLKYWQSEAVKKYGFSGIPHTVLVDDKGIIIAKNLRGPALEAKLKEIFGF